MVVVNQLDNLPMAATEGLVNTFVEAASCSFDLGVVACTAIEVGHTFVINQGPSSLAAA